MQNSPSSLIQLFKGAKSFGSRQLFEGAQFAINENEHVGVIGPNGAGKTSLFKIISGEMDLDAGELVSSNQLRLGYLKQIDDFSDEISAESFVQESAITPIWELKKLARGLGLTEAIFSKKMKELSGGYRMRLKLLQLIGRQPNLMLLDEPTNYLDLETLLVLESFLQDYEGAFLLISHDREFLRRTTDHILEIEGGVFTKYSGNIDDYFSYKDLVRSQQEKAAAASSAKRQEVLDFAARFGAKASKARQAQSRLKQLEKMEQIELKPLPVAARISLPPPPHTGRLAIEISDADMGYPDKCVLQAVDLKIESGSRIGIVGFNGEGKSTFLKSVAKEIPCLHGSVDWGYQVEVSYYAQHVTERLRPDESVLDALKRSAHSSISTQEIMNLGGALLFAGEDIHKPISVLSGGEKARVALGQILLRRSPVLLLDEPTNHLDFYTVEALTQALETYKGCVLIVSHDRGFIRRVANQIMEVDRGQLRLYPGSYDEYVWVTQQRQAKVASGEWEPEPIPSIKRSALPEAPQPRTKPGFAAASGKLDKEQQKKRRKELKEMEKKLQEVDKKIKALERRMEEQASLIERASSQKATEISIELSATKNKIESLEGEFFELMSQKEEFQKEGL